MTPSPDQSYREIPLTQGQVAFVDEADFEWLNQWKWFAHISTSSGAFYAQRNSPRDGGKQRTVLMHREILGLGFGDPRIGDHVTPSLTLDNRRYNLRIADAHESACNRGPFKNNTTGFKGVKFHNKVYEAWISVHGKKIYLGRRRTAIEASVLYLAALKKYHGEFSNTSL